MIYIFVGPSCSGKTSIIRNTFMSDGEQLDGDLPYWKNGNVCIIGNYSKEKRIQGLDSISRAEIKKIVPFVIKLCNDGYDVVLDGERIYSYKYFDELLDSGFDIKLYYIRISDQESIRRNHANNATCGDAILKRHATLAKNLYWEYFRKMHGQIIDTENVDDYSKINLDNCKYVDNARSANKRFAIFILSHGRANTITTYNAIRKGGYTGDMYVVIDNEDDQEQLYRDKFGEEIIQFDKRDYVPKTDLGDLDDDRRIGVFARNFIQDKAQDMGYKYHLQLDDDIHGISLRYEKNGRLLCHHVTDIDRIINAILDYMDNAPFTSLSFGIPAYCIGGINNHWKKQMIPKCMTTFIMRASDKQYFHMRMNDDITTSAINNMRGLLYYSIVPIQIDVDATQVQKGGMTEIYKDNGTYRKSFYSVMSLPSCAKVSTMGINDYRVHHEIIWNNCVPKILNPMYQKR